MYNLDSITLLVECKSNFTNIIISISGDMISSGFELPSLKDVFSCFSAYGSGFFPSCKEIIIPQIVDNFSDNRVYDLCSHTAHMRVWEPKNIIRPPMFLHVTKPPFSAEQLLLIEFLSVYRFLVIFFGWGTFSIIQYMSSDLHRRAVLERKKRVNIILKRLEEKILITKKKIVRLIWNKVIRKIIRINSLRKDYFRGFFAKRNISLAIFGLDIVDFEKVKLHIDLMKLDLSWVERTVYILGYNLLNRMINDANVTADQKKIILSNLVNQYIDTMYKLTIPYIVNLCFNGSSPFLVFLEKNNIDIETLSERTLYKWAIAWVINQNKDKLKGLSTRELYKVACDRMIPLLLISNQECIFFLLRIARLDNGSVTQRERLMTEVVMHYHPGVELSTYLHQMNLLYVYDHLEDTPGSARFSFPTNAPVTEEDWEEEFGDVDDWSLMEHYNSDFIPAQDSESYDRIIFEQLSIEYEDFFSE